MYLTKVPRLLLILYSRELLITFRLDGEVSSSTRNMGRDALMPMTSKHVSKVTSPVIDYSHI
jgi:hypothetical protein